MPCASPGCRAVRRPGPRKQEAAWPPPCLLEVALPVVGVRHVRRALQHLQRVAVAVDEAGAREEAQQQTNARRVHWALDNQRPPARLQADLPGRRFVGWGGECARACVRGGFCA